MGKKEIIRYMNERIKWLESKEVSEENEKLKRARISELSDLLEMIKE